MHVLCLRCEDTILLIVCTGLSINTTVIHEWINNLILQMHYSECIDVGANYILSHDSYSGVKYAYTVSVY